MALSFDMDLASSVAIDGSGNVTPTPAMTAAMAAATGTGNDPWLGNMQTRKGVVSGGMMGGVEWSPPLSR